MDVNKNELHIRITTSGKETKEQIDEESRIRIMAASAATQEEIELAKTKYNDGSKPVATEKRPYRPKLASLYEEPTYLPDDDDTLEVLYRSGGVAISKNKSDIGERDPDTIILYNEETHGATLNKSIQWEDCPEEWRPEITEIIKRHWDVFAPEGLKNHIRGFVCHIDTGTAQPVCCNIPRYGPHEARVITQLTRGLEANGLIEEAQSPWGAQVVLAAKPNQDHVHWSEYVWRLTVSYRKLNTITRPFIYPSRRCDDAARDIGKSKHFITMDFESGFWQVLLHEKSRDKTAYFVPGGQKRWTVMPMGCLNAHGTFCCLVDNLKRQWNAKATDAGIRDDIEVTLKGERPWTDAEVIVDDIMLHSESRKQLVKYFEIALEVLKKHQVTVKLKKCRFFPRSAEFVGMDVEADGNRPARSKMQALEDLKSQPLRTVTDLRQFIGLIGFYQDWIANYELRIGRWRQHIKALKSNGATENETSLATVWQTADNELMTELIEELIKRPTLARPDYTRRFYLKTDWCRLGMAAVLLQANPTDKAATEHERQETHEKQPCKFDKHMHQLRLRPIAFASRKCSEQEGNLHSFTGEAATGVWAIEKYKRHLFGKEFTWMTDCNGLRQFFEGEDVPTHVHQRMRQRLLRFMFTIVHRPARFLTECDVLTRYNNLTSQWRPGQPKQDIPTAPPIGIANEPIKDNGNRAQAKTLLAQKINTIRDIWVYNAGATNIDNAIDDTGLIAQVRYIEDRAEWRRTTIPDTEDPKLITLAQLEDHIGDNETVDWIVVQDGRGVDETEANETEFEQITKLIQIGTSRPCKAILIFTRPRMSETTKEPNTERRTQELEGMGWNVMRATVRATRYGAAIAAKYTMIVATRNRQTMQTFHLQHQEPTPLEEFIDDEREPDEPNINISPEIRSMRRPNRPTRDATEPRIAAYIQRKGQDTYQMEWITAWTPCFDVSGPGPELTDATTQWYESIFAIEIPDHRTHTTKVRGIRLHELMAAIGYDENSKMRMVQQPPEINNEQLQRTPPKQLITAALIGIHDAETRTQQNEHITTMDDDDAQDATDDELHATLRNMLAHEFHQTTTIPLPTTAQWQDETAKDEDMRQIRDAIRNNTEIQPDQIHEQALHKLWAQGQIEEEDGILYHCHQKDHARHVRTKIPPPSLRQAIFSALHTSPMAGHTGYQKTYWKIAARYYWPRMSTDIKQLTLGCGHCNAANITSHEAQQELQTFHADQPFDVITMDVWHPGKAATTKKGNGTHVVTCIDSMTGFAAATFVDAIDSETMTRAAFTAFFINHGLPRLVIIDSGSEFAGSLQVLCQNINLPHYTVSKENHKAIICERFHRYMNKVQKIHAADCETFQDFMFGTIFAVYAWNSAPVDGTNIVRSYAAIGREFPFPIDFEREPIIPRAHGAEGQQTIDHVESTFPLLRQQQQLLKILVDERREHHRNLKNASRNMKTFAPGDLVIIKKQVQTRQETGPAKARIKARGPYRILEEVKPGTYKVQRLPGTQGAGRRGKVTKESAARMTKIPSTLVIHKPTAGIDTRLTTYRHAMVDNPLETVLGLHEAGRYQQAAGTQPFAYDRIEDLWPEPVEDDSEGNNNEQSDSDSDSSGDDNEPDEDNDDHGGEQSALNETANTDETTETNPNNATETTTNTSTTTTANQQITENTRNIRKRKRQTTNAAPTTTQPTRASRREAKRPARYRSEEHQQVPKQTRTSETGKQQKTRAHKLYQQIRKSRDRLFFIKHIADTTRVPKWYAVQVQLDDDTTEERDEGTYNVWFLIRELANSKERIQRNCRYYPEVHQLRNDGTMGPIIQIRPGRVTTALAENPTKYRIYEQRINLLEHALAGPFDFAFPRHYQNEANRIAFED